ncbi:hypothetical protein TorRG33x02_118510 [Trema orientale]|uniref:Uncharacterized protein n=1 Tax=Trema orientale TaxID=63057 RepID=A0A2P5F3I3_TREOI|nr:hypothetical protein TorRG33x02_118510 [Trema orientale]
MVLHYPKSGVAAPRNGDVAPWEWHRRHLPRRYWHCSAQFPLHFWHYYDRMQAGSLHHVSLKSLLPVFARD